MTSPTFQASLQFAHRGRKQAQIEDFFEAHLNQRFNSYRLHGQFGPSFRSRVSDINRDPGARITIQNANVYDNEAGAEISAYWAELRIPHKDLG